MHDRLIAIFLSNEWDTRVRVKLAINIGCIRFLLTHIVKLRVMKYVKLYLDLIDRTIK